MSDQDKPNSAKLVPAGRSDLTPLVSMNPLVARGLADLAKIQQPNDALSFGNSKPPAMHPFRMKMLQKLAAKLKPLHVQRLKAQRAAKGAKGSGTDPGENPYSQESEEPTLNPSSPMEPSPQPESPEPSPEATE